MSKRTVKTKRSKNTKLAPGMARALHESARDQAIRLDTTQQIAVAIAQVLKEHYGFTPEQILEFSGRLKEQIRLNNQQPVGKEPLK